MESSSSDQNQRPRSGSSRNSNRNRNQNRGGNRNQNRGGNRNQGGNRNRGQGGNRNRSGGGNQRNRSRRPEPKPTGFQKFIKAITFGLIDPTKKAKKSSSQAKKTDRRRIIEEPTTPRLYIGNLNYDLTDEELKAVFEPVGKVASAAVVRHGDSGRSKGFGFVEMGSLEEAKEAVRKLNDTDLKGRQLLVSGAKAEKPREREERRGEGNRRSGEGRERRDSRGRDRRESGDRRDREGSRNRRSGGRSGERGGKGRSEKPARQLNPPKIEQVSTPRLLVSNLNKDATDQDIADLFDGIGEVREKSELAVKDGAATGEMVVEFSEVSGAQSAVELVDMKFFMGNKLRVKGAPVEEGVDSPAGE